MNKQILIRDTNFKREGKNFLLRFPAHFLKKKWGGGFIAVNHQLIEKLIYLSILSHFLKILYVQIVFHTGICKKFYYYITLQF